MYSSLAMRFVVDILIGEVATGNYRISVDRAIQESIDSPGMQLMEQQLSENLGQDFKISRDPVNDLLHVYTQPQFSMEPGAEKNMQPAISQKTATTTRAAGRKNPPRPSNCFILFRTHKHPEVKRNHPMLPVQEICKFHPSSVRVMHLLLPC